MTNRLTLNDEKPRWYPESIGALESHLEYLSAGKRFFDGDKYYTSRKNIAYSLQYLEFLDRVIKDISLVCTLDSKCKILCCSWCGSNRSSFQLFSN